jgi:hypothetical protein
MLQLLEVGKFIIGTYWYIRVALRQGTEGCFGFQLISHTDTETEPKNYIQFRSLKCHLYWNLS